MNIKATIFDWGRTLHDPDTKKEFPEAEEVLALCKERGHKTACASLVGASSNATKESRLEQIENSLLRKYFDSVHVTDTDKDEILDRIVSEMGLPRNEILIVDDRMKRGVKYGNLRGHPTVWIQKGKFENELPDEETKDPTFIIKSIGELKNLI